MPFRDRYYLFHNRDRLCFENIFFHLKKHLTNPYLGDIILTVAVVTEQQMQSDAE